MKNQSVKTCLLTLASIGFFSTLTPGYSVGEEGFETGSSRAMMPAPQQSDFEKLNSDLIYEIFKFIRHPDDEYKTKIDRRGAKQVCKKFYDGIWKTNTYLNLMKAVPDGSPVKTLLGNLPKIQICETQKEAPATALLGFLPKMTDLKSLELHKVDANALREITFPSTLETLVIKNSALDKEAAVLLGKKLPQSLKHFYAPLNKIAGEVLAALFPKLAQLPNLETLELSGNQIGSSIGELAYNYPENLKHLGLKNNDIGQTNTSAFQRMFRVNYPLETLELGGNQLEDDGVFKLLGTIPTGLKKLGLANNELTDTATRYLGTKIKKLPQLQELDLERNVNITGTHLVDVLRNNFYLRLGFTFVGETPANRQAIENAARNFSNLTVEFEY